MNVPSVPRLLLYVHLLLFVIVGFLASAALAGGVLAYRNEPDKMVLAGILGTALLSAPAILLGYPLLVRMLFGRYGYAITHKQLAILVASFLGSYAFSALMTAGIQSGTPVGAGQNPTSDVDLFLIAFFCGWLGSLLAQMGIGSVMHFDNARPVKKAAGRRAAAPPARNIPRSERRAQERAERKASRKR